MHKRNESNAGFTIVELLIVVVLIAILATISVVAYTNIQNRANDAAVQSDLKNIGKKFQEFQATTGRLPVSSADYTPMNLHTTRSSYANNTSPDYNLAYCPDSPTGTFVLVAVSRSTNVYVFKDGASKPGVGPVTALATTCSNNGQSTTSNPDWFYHMGSWRAWIGG